MEIIQESVRGSVGDQDSAVPIQRDQKADEKTDQPFESGFTFLEPVSVDRLDHGVG